MKELIRKHVEEATNQLTEVGSIELGSDMYVETVKGVSTLTKDAIELERLELDRKKIEYEHEEKMAALNNDLVRMEEDKKDRKWKNWLTAMGIGLPVAGAVWANVYNWYKEQEGIMSSSGGKKAMSFLQQFKSK